MPLVLSLSDIGRSTEHAHIYKSLLHQSKDYIKNFAIHIVQT